MPTVLRSLGGGRYTPSVQGLTTFIGEQLVARESPLVRGAATNIRQAEIFS